MNQKDDILVILIYLKKLNNFKLPTILFCQQKYTIRYYLIQK